MNPGSNLTPRNSPIKANNRSGKKHGIGLFNYRALTHYRGEFSENISKGVGQFTNNHKVYKGAFSDGRRDGFIFLSNYSTNKIFTSGTYARGRKNGYFLVAGDGASKLDKLEFFEDDVILHAWFISDQVGDGDIGGRK